MERIPNEVLEMIFDRLPIGQLDECRGVCKKWQYTIENLISFDCLVVYNDCLPVNRTFFHSNEQLSLRYCIHADDFADESEFKKRIYRKFRRICFYDHFKTRFSNLFHEMFLLRRFRKGYKLPMLDYLSQLEGLWLASLIGGYRLVLPNLKFFKTDYISGNISLDAPQLTHLSLRHFALKIEHPETIETLEIKNGNFARDMFRFPLSRELQLMSLTGLKYLLIEGETMFDSAASVKNFGLTAFLRDRLSELHLLGRVNFGREFCQLMRELKEQPSQIRIYFNGLEMDCFRKLLNDSTWLLNQQARDKYLKPHGLLTSDQRNLYLSNRLALSELLPLYQVNYNLIETLGSNGLDLFSPKRLSRLEVVVVNEQVKDELAFGRWLGASKTLIEILFECPLSQNFYSSTLPVSCPNLQGLTLQFDAPLDFSFLLKFRFLYMIDLKSSDYGLVELLFSNLAYLRYLAFYECNSQTTRLSLGVVKNKTIQRYSLTGEYLFWKKEILYEVYDGIERNLGSLNLMKRYAPVKVFESFESLLEFAKEFTGF